MIKAPLLSLENINLSFCTATNELLKVIENISMEINKQEIVAILGPSGCGKSTLLNIIAGIENKYEGKRKFSDFSTSMFNYECGFIFQKPLLFNWLTVKENIAYGLKLRKIKRKEREKIIDNIIQQVGLNGFEKYYPDKLSGGMQQRVALARVLVLEPKLLLMDEPFAALDAQLRNKMQQLVLNLWQRQKQSIVFVTHDVEEAIILSHRIYILSSRPSHVITEIDVPFKDKKNMNFIDTYEFVEFKKEVKNSLVNQLA